MDHDERWGNDADRGRGRRPRSLLDGTGGTRGTGADGDVLGWEPKFDLVDGMAATLAWVRDEGLLAP